MPAAGCGGRLAFLGDPDPVDMTVSAESTSASLSATLHPRIERTQRLGAAVIGWISLSEAGHPATGIHRESIASVGLFLRGGVS